MKAETARQQMILLFPYDDRIKQYRTEVMVHDQVGPRWAKAKDRGLNGIIHETLGR